MGELEGKTVLVTGAAGPGIGKGICEAIAAAGGRLVMNDIDESRLQEAVKSYPAAVAAAGDLRDASAVAHVFQTAAQEYGVIDGLVNNAGIGLGTVAHEVEQPDYDRFYELDVQAVWQTTKLFIGQLLEAQRPGNIVNISSVHAHATMKRYSLYAGAKSYVEGFTRGIAMEYGERFIRCNAIAPGFVPSEQNIPLMRTWTDDPEGWIREHTVDQQALPYLIEPRDCGELAVFLLSDRSRCITGQSILLDAGTTSMLYNRSFI